MNTWRRQGGRPSDATDTNRSLLPFSKDCWQPPGPRRGKEGVFSEPSEGVRPCHHLDFGLPASTSVREHISLSYLKSLSLWQFVPTALRMNELSQEVGIIILI